MSGMLLLRILVGFVMFGLAAGMVAIGAGMLYRAVKDRSLIGWGWSLALSFLFVSIIAFGLFILAVVISEGTGLHFININA